MTAKAREAEAAALDADSNALVIFKQASVWAFRFRPGCVHVNRDVRRLPQSATMMQFHILSNCGTRCDIDLKRLCRMLCFCALHLVQSPFVRV